MFDFEFCIDTGNSPPVYYRQPVYRFHESKIITKLMADLEANKFIRDCEGLWGSLPFIRRLCVSYRPLNKITLGFEFPIHRCVDSIEDLGDSCGPIFTISLDTRTGYHQLRVRKCDQEKLTFFTPSGEKKTYDVLPFVPKNTPSFYTAMMQTLRKIWLLLYTEIKHLLHLDSAPVTIMCNEKIFIDDILLYSNNVKTLIHYFSCVTQVFIKYSLSFKLTKCEFFYTSG